MLGLLPLLFHSQTHGNIMLALSSRGVQHPGTDDIAPLRTAAHSLCNLKILLQCKVLPGLVLDFHVERRPLLTAQLRLEHLHLLLLSHLDLLDKLQLLIQGRKFLSGHSHPPATRPLPWHLQRSFFVCIEEKWMSVPDT